MRALLRVVLLSLCACLAPVAAISEERAPATLLADSIEMDPQTGILQAEGNVEIYYNGARLNAASVTYDRRQEALTVEGPLYIREENGTTIRSEYAELSTDLREGMLSSARLVYSQQLQLAAAEIRRTNGRFTQFYKTVASSCQICAEQSVPLWEIRAKRVVHDGKERQLYFENAVLRVGGLPVFYTPYLRLPDPSVKRSTGFLFPEIVSNGDIGVGAKIPYFITLGDHADLTFTPWFTNKGNTTLEARYRKKFHRGEIEINGAVTKDDSPTEGTRGYVFAEGTFSIGRGFTGRFDIEMVSDPGYLLLYGFSDKDRLDSAISVERVRRNELISAELIYYDSLRDEDDNSTLTSLVAGATYEKRIFPGLLGGRALLTAETFGLYRRADNDPTDSGLARDALRFSVSGDWRRDWRQPNGMIITAKSLVRADWFEVFQDDRPEYDDTVEVTPYAALEWRWPLHKQGRTAKHLIEPVAQLVWSDDSTAAVVNEDSLLVEFDEANLFEFSRFPGEDAQEKGKRINFGVTYTREDARGWDLSLTVGRIIRDSDLQQFSVSTGLQGTTSDWLVAAQLSIGERVDIISRAVFDDTFSLARNETRFTWLGDDYQFGSSFVWLEADPSEGRDLDISEWTFEGAYRTSRHWTVLGDLRYDFVGDRSVRAGMGARYQNECIRVDLSASRRFTSSTSVTPTTELSLSVQLAGFGARGIGGETFARRCNG
ncbi:MAG: LPS-assembly protein LptD [Paracoccaceae bacterium]